MPKITIRDRYTLLKLTKQRQEDLNTLLNMCNILLMYHEEELKKDDLYPKYIKQFNEIKERQCG